MIEVLRTTGRALRMHWPVLLAWQVAGTLGWYVSIELAGYVGAVSAIAGSLLLPIGILCRLIPFVAMLLVVRDEMRALQSLAPVPAQGAARRTAFLDALLAGILPFFAFYAAWGYLEEDTSAYFRRVLETNFGFAAQEITGAAAVGDGQAGSLGFGPLSIALVVVAFTARWLLGRYRSRLPKIAGLLAAYLEALWVFLTLFLIRDALDLLGGWVADRQAMVWLADVREAIAQGFAPLAFVWEGVEWLLGEAGGLILLPVAWLAIAGVVYGQAVAPERLKIRVAMLDGVRERYRSVPARVRARLSDLWASITGRFRPIGAALVLMWRAGPVLIGGYVLLYTVLIAVERLLFLAATRLVGPHDLAFWFTNMELVTVAVPFLVEPLRVALVAGAYDAVIGTLIVRRERAAADAAITAQASVETPETAAAPPTAGPAGEPAPASLRRHRRRP
ncbi:MAG: hypothetical protein ABW024_09355 [Microbacterium sp.]